MLGWYKIQTWINIAIITCLFFWVYYLDNKVNKLEKNSEQKIRTIELLYNSQMQMDTVIIMYSK